MLTTSANFDAAVDANTTEVDCRVKIEREINAVADSITVSAVTDPIDSRFHKENIVNIRNPRFNGIAYGPVTEFFTSDNPKQGFRMISDAEFDDERDQAYYIPKEVGTNFPADVTIDYAQNFNMNCIEVRYENSRTSTTYYDDFVQIYVTPSGGGETQVHNQPMNTDGVTRIYWNGASWSESEAGLDPDGTGIRNIRVRTQRNTYNHQTRLMYVGGIHIVDVSDDIIDVSVDKTEFNQSTYLPLGEPSGNTCSVRLDNTEMTYRFGPAIDRNFFLKNQRITVEFGVNTKYGGGADAFEYVPGGTFYIEDYGYNEKEMTVNISGQDFSKYLQEIFCGNYLWIDKSLKYIVYDVLARSGVSPRNVVFDFGVAGNNDESRTKDYTWSHEDQTVWDFLSQLAKSELGTVFYDESENLVFTDRLDMDDKYAAGVQYDFDASVNLESIDEQFNVSANKVKVPYEKLAANTTAVNIQLVKDADGRQSYELGPEKYLNQILWQPDDEETYLGSATLSRTLNPTDSYLYVSEESAIQITRDEGEVLVGDEFITYNGVSDMGSGERRLTIANRDNRNTVYNGTLTPHKGWYSNYNLRHHVKFDRDYYSTMPRASRSLRKVTPDGYRQRFLSRDKNYWNTMQCTEFESDQIDYNTDYRIYGARFRFNEIKGYIKDQAAGIYINMVQDAGRGIFFEISNPDRPEIVANSLFGNARAYKTSNWMNAVPLPPAYKWYVDEFRKAILYAEASETDDGTFIDITVLEFNEAGQDKVIWYVNGEFMGKFETEYSNALLQNNGLNPQEVIVGNTPTQEGRFGFFTRGSTDVTLDFIYASNDNRIGPDELLQSRGFSKYFDSHTKSWNVRQDYFFDREYYVEFGAPVHEVKEFQADHDIYPNLYARILNTDSSSVTVFKSGHSPFTSNILAGNTARIGIDLNNTVYYPDGTSLDHSFFVYGVTVVGTEKDSITTTDAASIRRYGLEEVEFLNPWVNTKDHAVKLAAHIRKFWSKPQQFFSLDVAPNPALQVRDRVTVTYTDKGFETSDVWFVNGIQIKYDGGFSSTVTLKKFDTYPVGDLDYREDGGIIIT